MSSSTATISSKTSSVNANDRKRSIRSSPSPPLMKRNGLMSTTSDQSRTNSDRTSRSTQQIQTMDDQRSSSTDSNHSTVSLDSNSKPPAIVYDSEEDFQTTKTNSMLVSSTASKKDNVIIQQLTKPHSQSNSSTKLVKLVAPQSTSSIKMLSSDGGFTSALRIPTRIQLTKTLHSSSIKTDIINQEQMNHFENLQDNQQTVGEYHSSTAALPPTPPPPVIDNTNANIEISEQQTQDQQQQQQQHNDTNDETKEKLTNNNNNNQKNDSTNIEQQQQQQQQSSTRHAVVKPTNHLSDWSVPPTSELSPRSLTSSSPDLTQQNLPVDDTLGDFDYSNQSFQPTQSRFRSVSPGSMPDSQNKTKQTSKSKSKSLTRLSNENKRVLTSLESTQKRRRNNEHLIAQQDTTKSDDEFIVQCLLNEIVERVGSANNEQVTTLVKIQQKISVDKQTKPTNLKKTSEHESRPMILTQKKLDELAYLLHSNSQRSEYEQTENSAKVEESMRETWSQMSNQKKKSYYNRVIQIYKRPNRNVIITSSTTELSQLDSIDNSSPISSIDYKRQTSTPLSFHSIASSTSDESSQQNIIIDVIDELKKGAKGLDKLSFSSTTFSDSIQTFVQSTNEQQIQMLTTLEQQMEKQCSSQLVRARLFWTQRIQYFATKHQLNSSDQSMNELALVVKYFYLFVLSLKYQKQQADFQVFLKDLIEGKPMSFDESYQSNTLTNIIDDLILPSSLASEYLAAQTIVINQIEHLLPSVRNTELENELFVNNEDLSPPNPFADVNELEDYLNRCAHTITNIPTYPNQPSHQAHAYYPQYQPPSYYYQTPDMNNYYYNSPSMYSSYSYGQPNNNYYHHHHHHSTSTNSNEQMGYYYNHQQQQQQQQQQQAPIQYSYVNQTNSTNDIPVVQRSYRPMNSTHQRTYSNSQMATTPTGSLTPSTPIMYDSSTIVSSQSPSSTSPQ